MFNVFMNTYFYRFLISFFWFYLNFSQMKRLECAVQHYAWGKTGRDSFIAQLLPADRVDVEKRYAELWMGTHPNGPSRVVGDGGETAATNLKEFLARNPQLLGDHEKGELSFLFKILSVDKALSIQSHPTKEQAKVLHAKDPANYPDDNHKPEMAIAITDFELLCGFQTPHGIISNIKAHRELLQLVGEPLLVELAHSEHELERGQRALRQMFGQVWTSPAEKIAHVVAQIVDRIGKMSDRAPVDELVLRLDSQFPGGDIGVLAPFFLNFFTLRPGQATFLGPNEPHAYLSGDCVECMALSDNTIRAGLTPKFKDVPTLCSSLTYRMYAPPIFEPKVLTDGTVEYSPPVAEFAVHKIECKVPTLRPIGAASILIVVAGSAALEEEGQQQPKKCQIEQGDVLFVPKNFGASLCDASPDLLAFRSFTPLPQ